MTSSGRPASGATRLLAGAAGATILVLGSIVALGTPLLAIGGLLLVHALWRRRGRRLSPLTSWLAAAGSTAIVVALASAIGLGFISDDFREELRSAASSEQADAEPPAWLQRVAPTTPEQRRATEERTERLFESDAFLYAMLVMITIMLAIMAGAAGGTLGWLGAVLLGYAALGRRPWRGGPAPDRSAAADDWAAA